MNCVVLKFSVRVQGVVVGWVGLWGFGAIMEVIKFLG